MNALLPETRERFLLAITQQVPAERIAEIHFFAPIKQGGVESGVAVVAAWPDAGVTVDQATPDLDASSSDENDSREAEPPSSRAAEPPRARERAPGRDAESKPVVYTARYRLILKGPDRGKWETSVTAEADAPLVSVDAVVRGVQRRAGDVEEATRMEGNEVRESLKGKI
ncbi:MAG TPA: hypothetical protein VNS10_15795 [Gemmatimonadaceae bacterium]|jgi:hypothetical protein|nr:hypothetical protein [Gemmatimonadaceae bacterium]